MKYKLDFSPLLTKLNGEVTKPETPMGQLLAAQLEMSRESVLPIRKLWIWATELYKTNTLELDKVDMELMEKHIENLKDAAALFKCALLGVFEKAKAEAEKAEASSVN
jgi:hypothetical protein